MRGGSHKTFSQPSVAVDRFSLEHAQSRQPQLLWDHDYDDWAIPRKWYFMVLPPPLNVLTTFQPYHMGDQAYNQWTISIHSNPVCVLWVPLFQMRVLRLPAIDPGLHFSPILFYFLLVDARWPSLGFWWTPYTRTGNYGRVPGVNPAMMWMSHNSQAHLVSWVLSYCFPEWLYWLTLPSTMLDGFCFPVASPAPGVW